MSNYSQISPVVFDKKIFKVFTLGFHGNHNSAWIIPVKFGEIPQCGLGDVI